MDYNSCQNQQKTTLSSNPSFINPGKNEKLTNLYSEKAAGTTITIDLQNGISMNIHEFIVSDPVIKYEPESHLKSIGLGFCMTGQLEADLKTLGKKYITKKGESSLFYISDINGSYKYFSSKPISRIFLEFEPNFFFNFLEDQRNHLPLELLNSAEKDKDIYYRSKDSITPQMDIILTQILSCPYHGTARDFFFQGKALELIAAKLDQLQKYQKGLKLNKTIKPIDIDRIIHVKELLAKNLQNPPSITDLARKLGASRTKLYKDFCDIHGDTPTNFLRDLRMKKAELLIREGKMNMTEIAYTIGYSNISYFAKVFRKYFSVPPSIYFKNIHSNNKA